eukprot:3564640-Rhodomonas_salina.5
MHSCATYATLLHIWTNPVQFFHIPANFRPRTLRSMLTSARPAPASLTPPPPSSPRSAIAVAAVAVAAAAAAAAEQTHKTHVLDATAPCPPGLSIRSRGSRLGRTVSARRWLLHPKSCAHPHTHCALIRTHKHIAL